MYLIERKNYLNRLIALRGTPDIKIITGVRRSGKSKIMEAYRDYLSKNDINANFIYLDLNDMMYEGIKEYQKLNEYILSQYKKGKNNYLFIDEIQECEKFEKVINSLHSKQIFDIYLTGSNAFLLSSDLATLFTGRYIEIKMYPFSFKEFCLYFKENNDLNDLFEKYFIMGGFAGSYVYDSILERQTYLTGIYKTIAMKDLVVRHKIKDIFLLLQLIDFLMDNISGLTTGKKISDTFCSNKLKTNHVTINNYLEYLCNSFLFYRVKRYDLKGKTYLDISNKYYLCDQGLRFANLGTKNLDYGHVIENIVYLELLRRGYEVYIGKLYQKEIDFIAKKANEQIYIQVADNISSPETLQRELAPLQSIKDSYPKIIIARTKHFDYSIEGIHVLDLVNWLMKE